jgi:fused signal recognition particle receptor
MNVGGMQIDPQQLVEVAAAVGGVGVTALFGFLLVKRARASRLRQIEGLDAGQPTEARPRRVEKAKAREADAEGDEAPSSPASELEPEPESDERAPEPPAPAKRPKDVERGPRTAEPRATGQVIPFPLPSPSPVVADVPGRRERESLPEPSAPRDKPRPPPAAVPPGAAVDAVAAPTPAKKRKSADALAPGLARTRSGWISRLGELFAGKREIDPSLLDEVEKVLLTADIGVRTSAKLLEEMRASLSRRELGDAESAWAFLERRTTALLSLSAPPLDWGAARPFVLLIIGVNGSGKTTTIGKLAARLIADGKKVLVGAGDTFRAAAAEQLEIWTNRVGATLVRGKEGADPSSVLFDAVKRGVADGFDVVIADTAGRLHTKTDLMEELQKVRRVIGKAAPGAPHETWLVIDSTSGQNAIAQAQIFTQAMSVSGIVLTKLDGTAKGGVILGIADQLQIPVRFIGIGERVEDLREFDAEEFVEALYQRQDVALRSDSA